MARWSVLVRYATKQFEDRDGSGTIQVEYDVDDLEDIAVLIAQGPNGFASVAYIHVRNGDEDLFPVVPLEGGAPIEMQKILDEEVGADEEEPDEEAA